MRCTHKRTCTEKKKFPFTTFFRSAIAAFIGRDACKLLKRRGKKKEKKKNEKEKEKRSRREKRRRKGQPFERETRR